MKKSLLVCIALLGTINSVFGQTEPVPSYFIVTDPDGYVNVRDEPSNTGWIREAVRSLSVVELDPADEVADDWIYCRYRGRAYGDFGYIHRSRLTPVDPVTAALIAKYAESESYYEVYAFSAEMPGLFLFRTFDDSDMTVRDLTRDEILFSGDQMTNFPHPVWGDTISFYCLYFANVTDPQSCLRPLFAHYKPYRKPDGSYDFYTELLPAPRTVFREEARRIVNRLREQSSYPSYWDIIDLFTAYCSGEVEAYDILLGKPCDAALCTEIGTMLSAMDAWRRSKLKPLP